MRQCGLASDIFPAFGGADRRPRVQDCLRLSVDAQPLWVEYVGPIRGPESVPFTTDEHPRGLAHARITTAAITPG